MIADLIAIGIFSAQTYQTPAERTLILPGINVNRAPLPCPSVPPKYSADNVDYLVDWGRYLLGDTIASGSVQTIDGDVVPTRMIFNDTTCSFFLGGGTPESMSRVQCQVTTVVGRTFDFVLQLNIRYL